MALGLRKSPPAVSTERQALAAAIDQASEARRREAALQTAAAAADRRVLGLVREREAAQQAVQAARQGSVNHLLAVAGGQADGGPSPHQQAQKRLSSVEAEMVEARVAAESVREAVNGGAEGARAAAAARRLAEASRAVLAAEAAPVAQRLAAEVVAMERDLAAKLRLLRFLLKVGAVPRVTVPSAIFGEPADADVRHCLQRLGRLTEPDMVERTEQPWAAALAALQQDAAAPLPAVTA